MRLAAITCRFFVAVLPLGGLVSCASDRRVQLEPYVADSSMEVQALARAARAGDKRAQLALGQKYERGDGVPLDASRAETLFRAAATDSGGTRMMFVPLRNGAVAAVPVSHGPSVKGLHVAKMRLDSISGSKLLIDGKSRGSAGSGSRAKDRMKSDSAAFSLSWFEGRAAGSLDVSRCELGGGVSSRSCQPAAPMRASFKRMDALYTSRPVAALDGALSCHGVVCIADGGGRAVIEVAKSDCTKAKLAALSSSRKYLLVRVFCQTPSDVILSTDYVNQEFLQSRGLSMDDLVTIYKGEAK